MSQDQRADPLPAAKPPPPRPDFGRFCILQKQKAADIVPGSLPWQDIEKHSMMAAFADHAKRIWSHERFYYEEELVFVPSKWTETEKDVLCMTGWDVANQEDVCVFLTM